MKILNLCICSNYELWVLDLKISLPRLAIIPLVFSYGSIHPLFSHGDNILREDQITNIVFKRKLIQTYNYFMLEV